MKKEEALRIILDCSHVYNINLENQNYLFVCKHCNNFDSFECVFYPRNFLHLTGAKLNNSLSSVDFYTKCLHHQLSQEDFELACDGTTELKLFVLPQLVQIHKTAKMIGDFTVGKISLQTDKLVGNVRASLGFVKENNYYIPNTALKLDIRDITISPQKRIIAIFSKNITDSKYTKVRYLSKEYDFLNFELPVMFHNVIDMKNLKKAFASIVS